MLPKDRIIPFMSTDKSQIQLGFSKACQTYASEAGAQQQMVERLMELWPQDKPMSEIKSVFEFGCGSGFLTRLIRDRFSPEMALINDLSPSWEPLIKEVFPDHKGWKFLSADAEELTLSESYDLIASSASLQWFERPAEFLARMFDALKPEGILLISTFGKDNLKEIRQITAVGLEYPAVELLFSGLASAAALRFEDQERISLSFASPLDVLRHLKRTGVNKSHSRFWTPAMLREFEHSYETFRCPDGSYPLTYHPIYICVQKKS